MTLADSAGDAFVVTLAVAALAFVAKALTWDGALAGFAVGMCVSAGFGTPGLAVLGTFFVVGTLATRIGWKTKKVRGTAEAGEGRRDWKRVLGKGGVAAAIALLVVLPAKRWGFNNHEFAFVGAVAAALADTLGTEVGTLWPGKPRSVPWFRPVPPGTPGAMSSWGTAATILGGVTVAAVAALSSLGNTERHFVALAAAGPIAAAVESIAVGLGLRAPGFVRNVLTTLVGALVTYVTIPEYFGG